MKEFIENIWIQRLIFVIKLTIFLPFAAIEGMLTCATEEIDKQIEVERKNLKYENS